MSTGYTADIEKGISFKQYAIRCARAFDACIEMRDDDWDKAIPKEFPVNDYDKKELAEAQKELEKYKKMKVTEAKKQADKEYKEELVKNTNIIRQREELKKKYEKMLEEVRKWRAPSSDHIDFKTFMESQITDSMSHDCDIAYYVRNAPVLKTGEQWLKERIEMANRDIEYHTKNYGDEVKRNNERNLWLKQLRESLRNI